MLLQDIKLPPKSEKIDVLCPLCMSKLAHRKALMEHIQIKHLEHLYAHLLGLGNNAVKKSLDKKLYTCDICLPKEIITFTAKSALNRHHGRFHSNKQKHSKALKRKAAVKCSKSGKFSDAIKCNTAPTIEKSYSLRVTSSLAQKIWGEGGINPSSVSTIKQESVIHPNSEPEPFPLSVIKEEFECAVCLVKFPCSKELESHWTVHFGHYIHYSDSSGTQ